MPACIEVGDAMHDEDEDEDAEVFRVGVDGEADDLVVESAKLEIAVGKPLYAECPACGQIVARGAYHIDVEVRLSGGHGFAALIIGLDQPDVLPARVTLPSSTQSVVGSVRLRSVVTLRDDSALQIFGVK